MGFSSVQSASEGVKSATVGQGSASEGMNLGGETVLNK